MQAGVLCYATAAALPLRSTYSRSTSATRGTVSGEVGGLEKKELPRRQAVLAMLLAVEK